MNYTLRGKIARAHPYQLDKTLTVEGAGAEAQATGEFIAELRSDVEKHTSDKNNPHNVTKKQLGLELVDNTPDTEKPVSELQAAAISEAKQAGLDAAAAAQTAAQNAQTTADNAQTAADNAQTAADNAQVAADNAQTAAENALAESKTYSDGKHNFFTVTLTAEGWTGEVAPYTQTIEVEGILETDRPHWGLVYSEPEEGSELSALDLKLAEKEAYNLVDDLDTANGSVTFTCLEEKPEIALTIQMEVNR